MESFTMLMEKEQLDRVEIYRKAAGLSKLAAIRQLVEKGLTPK